MKKYAKLLRDILRSGEVRPDRTGTGTVSLFDKNLRFDLKRGFPLVTGKATNFDVVAEELRWFLSGSTKIEDLKSKIWHEWALENGTIGEGYGFQWRFCPKLEFNPEYGEVDWFQEGNATVDQIQTLIDGIKSDPYSRRHILNSWNVGMLHMMALAPCHVMAQFYVRSDGALNCKVTQRSADVFLGLPFNIASYALLTHLLAKICGLSVGVLTMSIGDAHIYSNHIEQVKEYLTRSFYELPKLSVSVEDETLLNGFEYQLSGYFCGGRIKALVSI